jgi:hypothetical protein
MMNPNNGRSKTDCFVEFITRKDAINALEPKKSAINILKGRHVTITLSSPNELIMALFPYWIGSIDSSGKFETCKSDFITKPEVQVLLSACKRTSTTKCNIDRPYENIISILAKIPWHEPDLVARHQRDHIFELAKCKSC